MADVAQQPVFDFMMIRPPDTLADTRLRAGYIRDTVLTKGVGLTDVDLQSPQSPSAIGRLIFQTVFCDPVNPDPVAALLALRDAILDLVLPYQAECGGVVAAGDGMYRARAPRTPPDSVVDGPATPSQQPRTLDINDLTRHAYVRVGDIFYLLPDQLDMIDMPWQTRLAAMWTLMNSAVVGASPFAEATLGAQIGALFDTGVSPSTLVFSGSGFTTDFIATKRALFDALYLLYVTRRWATINFEPVMDGLRILHVLEALAIDEIYARGLAGTLTGADQATLGELAHTYPALADLKTGVALDGFPLIDSAGALAELLAARPIVHPIFGQLFGFARPFNAIQPIGIGDLKVVRQWLVAYEAGEISDIHNIMLGEMKIRNHRLLERSEDTFSSSSSSSTDTTHDTESTDRFEVKREAEQVIKDDLNVNANVRAQYGSATILVAVGAGFAYNHSSANTSKTAQNFSRDVVSKAVSRVQNSVVEQRSTTKIYETEETNTHTFDNTGGTGHVAGIYRWVDKRYKSQVYNYGKRLMFEFVLPEPAALYVQSRLRAFEASLDYPQQPTPPTLGTVSMPFTPDQITEDLFNALRLQYDLSQFTYPAATRTVAFVDQSTGGTLLAAHDIQDSEVVAATTYTCRLNAAGYEITTLMFNGDIYYAQASGSAPAWKDRNFFDVSLNGLPVFQADYSTVAYRAFYRPNDNVAPQGGPYLLTADDTLLVLSFQNAKNYNLEISAVLNLSPAALLSWQIGVYNVCAASAKKDVDDENQEKQTQYDAAMVVYTNKISDITATAIHDLIQGQSEAYNNDLITTELRRQCLSMITKEFDAYHGDDQFTDLDAMGSRDITIGYERLTFTTTNGVTTAGFHPQNQTVPYPLPDLDVSRTKGRYVQFLEQAFEWTKLGFICYPYFWAAAPKWMDLMGRLDDADPNFTSFLRAGSIKVLVAVAPAYEEAVMHFLATREPWDGGPAPVLGDPLYLPLFEELHAEQDDLYGGIPDGDPWEFVVPTSLVYLEGSTTPLPVIPPIAT